MSQILILGLMTIFLTHLLDFYLTLILILLAVLSIYYFNKSSNLERLEKLDQDQWSLKFESSNEIFTLKLTRVMSHRLYVVLFFEDKKHPSLIVWCDQLALKQWKSLLSRANLG
jgi:hypothetical protein